MLTALELEGDGGTGRHSPAPVLMAVATADCPGEPTAVAVCGALWPFAAAESQTSGGVSSVMTTGMLSVCLLPLILLRLKARL